MLQFTSSDGSIDITKIGSCNWDLIAVSTNLVIVSPTDEVPGTLGGKLVAGEGIDIIPSGGGGNETITITNTYVQQEVTITEGPGIDVGGTYPDFTVDHEDTSSVANVNTSGAQVIDILNFDTFGHVTGITLRNLTFDDLGGLPDEINVEANNAITEDVTNHFQWGGDLEHDTTVGGLGLHDVEFQETILFMTDGRFEMDKGAALVAANDLVLGEDGNSFEITGATQINAIAIADWQAGSVVYLLFNSSLTVKHNTAGGAGTAPILLQGAVDFAVDSGSVLQLIYNGTQWEEIGRKTEASAGSYLFRNAITESPVGIVELGHTTNSGSPLLHDTYINTTANHTLIVNGVTNTPNISFEVAEGASYLHKSASPTVPSLGSYALFAHNIHTISSAPTFSATYFYGAASMLERMNINVNSTQNAAALVAGGSAGIQLHSTVSSTYTVNPNGIQALAGFNTQVNLPTVSGGVVTTVNHATALQIWPIQQTPGATNTVRLTNYYGILINNVLQDSDFPSAMTNRWALYQEGATDPNYFAGNVGIGITVPTMKLQVAGGRFGKAKGADVTASGDLTLGADGNFFVVDGNTQIDAIVSDNWQVGSEITLAFTGTPTLKHNTAGGASTDPMRLLNGVDFTISKNPTIMKFVLGTAFWEEISRSANAA